MKPKKRAPMSPAERNRARDIRKAVAKHKAGGPPITREAAAWLRDYEARVQTTRRQITARRDELVEPAVTPTPSSSRKRAGTQSPAPRTEPPPLPDDDEDDDDDDEDEGDDDEGDESPSGERERAEPARPRRLSFVEDGEKPAANDAGPPQHAHERCPIKNCPECKNVAGSQVCGTTGKRVWEPIEDDEAEALGEGVLTVVGFFAGGVGWLLRGRKDPFVVVKPTDRDTERMGKASKKFAHRRANWIGEYSDLVLGVPAIVSHSKRTFNGETREERKAREERTRSWLDEDDDTKEKPDAAAAE